jgi:hypothetical protein
MMPVSIFLAEGDTMRQIFKALVVLVLLAGILLTGIFLVQTSITRKEHIAPAARLADMPHRVIVKNPDGTVEQATIQFVDTALVAAHGRMGNEIEEHLMILLVLNLITFALLITLCFITLRHMPHTRLCWPAWLTIRRPKPRGFEVVMPTPPDAMVESALLKV